MGKFFKSILILLAFSGPAGAQTDLAPVEVTLARDLGWTMGRSAGSCRPLLLEFAAESCAYCELLEEEFLKPMLRNRDYDQRVTMRKLLLDGGTRLIDFDGKPVSAEKLARRYRVRVTPTLLFLDGRGRELTERMVGINTPDFYGGYLDQALETAAGKLRRTGRCEQARLQ